MRGRAHKPDTKAQVIAALLLGASVMEVARELGLPQQTVSNYKSGIPPDKLGEFGTKKGERLDELVYSYMVTNLSALQKQAEVASELDYIKKQPAGELATLHGVMADKICRLLEAVSRSRPSEQPQLPA